MRRLACSKFMNIKGELNMSEKKRRKLSADQEHWATKVQTHPLPLWTEAFNWAYKLGYNKGLVASGEFMRELDRIESGDK